MTSRITAGALSIALTAASGAFAQERTSSQPPAEVKTQSTQESSGNPEGLVATMRRVADETKIVERLSGDVDGWYPRLGGMTRGGGFAIGPGYRTHVFDERIFVDLSTGISVKGYKSADANVRWWQGLGERVELWTDFRYEDFPQEDFFGIGMASSEAARASYDFDSAEFTIRGVVKPARWLRAGTSVGYMRPDIGSGTDKRYPSIEQVFTDVEAPGLTDQPDFIHTTLFGEVDYRDVRGNPKSGGHYRASFGIWDDRTLQQFDFKRFDVVLTQHLPLVADKSHGLTGRIGTSYVNNETGERVPFYFLAYVGGVDTIRGFREFRFKDENAIWMTAEYRWTPIKWVSAVAFLDAGEVSSDWHQIDFRGMETGYGFGFRVHSRRQTFGRIDFATGGGEGWQIFIKVGPSF
jgi:hypothetical protein